MRITRYRLPTVLVLVALVACVLGTSARAAPASRMQAPTPITTEGGVAPTVAVDDGMALLAYETQESVYALLGSYSQMGPTEWSLATRWIGGGVESPPAVDLRDQKGVVAWTKASDGSVWWRQLDSSGWKGAERLDFFGYRVIVWRDPGGGTWLIVPMEHQGGAVLVGIHVDEDGSVGPAWPLAAVNGEVSSLDLAHQGQAFGFSSLKLFAPQDRGWGTARSTVYVCLLEHGGETWACSVVYRRGVEISNVRVAASAGGLHLVWTAATRDDSSSHVWYRRCELEGTPCDRPVKLTWGPGPWVAQDVASYESHVFVGYSRDGELFGRYSPDAGSNWANPFAVPGDYGTADHWRMAATDIGVHNVFHADGTGENQIYYTFGWW